SLLFSRWIYPRLAILSRPRGRDSKQLLYCYLILVSRNRIRYFDRKFTFLCKPLREDEPPNRRKIHQISHDVHGRCGSLLLEASERETVVKRGTHRQSGTGRRIRSYLNQEEMRFEQNHTHSIDISWYGGERISSRPPQMGTLRWLLGRFGGRRDRRRETIADQW